MTPIIFINCDDQPFVDQILSADKILETRTRNMLKSLSGQRVLLAETHRGRKPIVRASVILGEAQKVTDKATFVCFRKITCIQEGSKYDWNDNTKYKYFYTLLSVRPVEPFTPPEGIRHGRVWMEYGT